MTTTALREDARPEAPAAKRRRRGLGWSGRLEVAILVGPALIVFLAFVIFPVVMAAYYGFFSWQGYGVPTDFVGFKNYLTILQDPTFHEALSHIGEDPEVEVTTCKVIAKAGYRIGDRVVRAAQVLVVDPVTGPAGSPADSPADAPTDEITEADVRDIIEAIDEE